MLHHMPFSTADRLTVNTGMSQYPSVDVRQLQYVVDLCNYLIAQ